MIAVEIKHRQFSVFLLIILVISVLASCEQNNLADWEDTLPTVSSRIPETEAVVVIYEEPESETTAVTAVTTTVTKKTSSSSSEPELATSTGTAYDYENEELLEGIPPVTVVPAVPITGYTVTTASIPAITAPPVTAITGGSNEEIISRTDTSAVKPDETPGFSNGKSINLYRPYSYRSLNDTQQYVYDMLINAMEHYRTELTIPASVSVSDEDYKSVYQLLYNDDSFIYYIGTLINYKVANGNKNIEIQYKYTQDEVLRMQDEIEAAADEILSGIDSGMTKYDIIRYFYDEITVNCVYDVSSPNCNDIYGCFVNKKAKCGGFSKAFNYLCSKAGIECILVTGDYEGPHMWNMVNIDNEWYHVDVTMGIVKNAEEKYVRYDYFCVTDDFIENNRTVYTQSYDYPEAVHSTYNYFYFNGLIAETYEDAERILYDEIIKAAAFKSPVIQFSCASHGVYEAVINNFFNPDSLEALNVLDAAFSRAEYKYDREAVKYNQDPNTLVIKIFPTYLD